MRNYLKYFAYRTFGQSTFFPPVVNLPITAFGRDAGEAAINLESQKQRVIAGNNPARDWEFGPTLGPIDYFFKLDKELIFNLLSNNPAFWWDNFIPPDQETTVAFPDNVQTEKSPRATFPTKLGTDGQRLRSGRTKDDGAALNYIGKLYFLTSKTAFKTLWNQLSAGKITAADALAQANALAQSR